MAVASKTSEPGFFERISIFIQEVKTELEKVAWPSKEELKKLTQVVLVALVILGIIIAGLDIVFMKFVKILLSFS